MAVPKRKTSKSRRDKRRTHYKLNIPGMSTCPKCGEIKLPHRVCKSCGTYKDVDVMTVD
ncbi:MAG: 50S ribosomal protein L32 [Eubacterium sp.]